jgi:hypothetical protein
LIFKIGKRIAKLLWWGSYKAAAIRIFDGAGNLIETHEQLAILKGRGRDHVAGVPRDKEPPRDEA